MTFGADAYRNEMGITNDLFPQESAFGVTPEQLRLCDPFPDPEDIRDPRSRRRGIDNFASFMRFLAPVERGDMNDQVRAGEQSLQPSGVRPATSRCWRQGPARIRCSIARERRFSPICSSTTSGPATDKQGAAETNEIRTPALWGLRFRRPLLHDGNATVEEAIARHAREAELARRVRTFERDRSSRIARLSGLAVAGFHSTAETQRRNGFGSGDTEDQRIG